MAAHGLLRPEQAEQIIRRKGVLTIEAAAKSLKESPTFLSTTEHSVFYAETKCQVPERSALSAHTHFPFIGSMMSCSQATSEHSRLNGVKASDWSRLDPRLEYGFHPKSFAPFSEQYPFGALQLHIPSRLEGMWGIVGKKAGGLADA